MKRYPAQISALVGFFGVLLITAPIAYANKKDIATLTRESLPATVLVVATGSVAGTVQQGSGFVVSANGQVVTNYHVMKGADSAVVKFPNGAFYFVSGIVAVDAAHDLVVLKIDGKDLPFLELGDSDKVQVGQEVLAIGSPLALEGTVSNGIISAIRGENEERLFQTTAPISHGSSGGALIDIEGRAIGITSLQVTEGQNLNFAIPVSVLKPLLAARGIQPLSSGKRAETPVRPMSDNFHYQGIVTNESAGMSASFDVTFTLRPDGAISGCMAVHRPLFGSGPLKGTLIGSQLGFEVNVTGMVLDFGGQKDGEEVKGTYLVVSKPGYTSVAGPVQHGSFVLRQQPTKAASRTPDATKCPDDAVVY
jgi:hypothetical protein